MGELQIYLELKNKKKALERDIVDLNKQITSYLLIIDNLQTQVNDTHFEIKETEKRIKDMEAEAGL